MRKISTLLLLALATMVANAATYGILVNDTLFYEAAALGSQDFQGRDQFKASVSLKNGDVICIYDETNKAKFWATMETGDGSLKANFTETNTGATCNTDACYDFYIKLKYEDNSMWVCAGTDCSANGRIIDEGGQGGDVAAWYYKGYIDGADVEPSEATKFTNGIVEFACEQKSYLFVIYQEQGKPGVQFMTEIYVDGGDSCLLKSTASAEKWGVEPFTGNLYLYYGDDATQVILSKVEIPGRVLVDTETALRPVAAESKQTVKMIKNGQLMIQQGNNIVDVFGRRITK